MRNIEIKGGASEFDAAVIAIVLDHIAREEHLVRQVAPQMNNEVPAWVRATPQLQPPPPDVIRVVR